MPDWEKDVADLTLDECWQDKHQDALRESSALIIILSLNNIDSPWISFELSAAVSDKKKIIPVLLDDIDCDRVPLPLRQFQVLREQSSKETNRNRRRSFISREQGRGE